MPTTTPVKAKVRRNELVSATRTPRTMSCRYHSQLAFCTVTAASDENRKNGRAETGRGQTTKLHDINTGLERCDKIQNAAALLTAL